MDRNIGAKGRRRPFYGWYVVAGMALVGGIVVALGGANYGVFVKPMRDSLGMGDAFFGWAQTARILGVAISAPLIGKLLDRHGARGPLAVAGLLTGVAVIGLALINAPWQMVAIFAVLGLLGMQGGVTLYTTVPIARWFVRRRSKAMSLTIVGIPIGIAISAPLTQVLIEQFGWRLTWFMLGVAGGISLLLIAILVIRRQPEDMGLLPDGAQPISNGEARQESSSGEEYQWTRSEAIRTGAFWRLAIVFGLVMFGQSTMVVFRFPYFVDLGISEGLAALSLSLEAITGIGVVLILGFALDRFRAHYVGIVGFVALTASYLGTMVTTEAWHMFATAMLLGMGIPIQVTLQNTIWPAYFGRAHVGSIRGISFPITVIFSAIGAPLAGQLRDSTGDYFLAWWIAIGAFVIGAVLLLLTPRPSKPTVNRS